MTRYAETGQNLTGRLVKSSRTWPAPGVRLRNAKASLIFQTAQQTYPVPLPLLSSSWRCWARRLAAMSRDIPASSGSDSTAIGAGDVAVETGVASSPSGRRVRDGVRGATGEGDADGRIPAGETGRGADVGVVAPLPLPLAAMPLPFGAAFTS